MKILSWIVLSALAAGLASAPRLALAQESFAERVGPYVGGSLGWTRAEDVSGDAILRDVQGQGLAVRTTDVRPNGRGWKVFVGHRFDRTFAVEGGYARLGRASFRGQVIADPGSVDATFEADVWNISAVRLWQLSDGFEVFGKAGLGWWKARLDAMGTFSAAGVQQSRNHNASPDLGLGGLLHVAPTWGLRVEWERFLDVGNPVGTGRTDINLVSLGVQHRF